MHISYLLVIFFRLHPPQSSSIFAATIFLFPHLCQSVFPVSPPLIISIVRPIVKVSPKCWLIGLQLSCVLSFLNCFLAFSSAQPSIMYVFWTGGYCIGTSCHSLVISQLLLRKYPYCYRAHNVLLQLKRFSLLKFFPPERKLERNLVWPQILSCWHYILGIPHAGVLPSQCSSSSELR